MDNHTNNGPPFLIFSSEYYDYWYMKIITKALKGLKAPIKNGYRESESEEGLTN